MHRSLTEGLLLVLSNLLLLPALFLTIRRYYYVDTAVILMMFLASSFYHACDAGWFCITDILDHRMQDHFMCTSLFSWLVLSFLGIPLDQTCSVFFLIVSSYVLFAQTCVDSSFFFVTLGFFFLFLILVRLIFFRHFLVKIDISDLVIAIILFVIGFIPFSLANVDDIEHYGVYHALWHFLSMPSIYFVIEARDGVPFYIHVIQYWISIRDFFLGVGEKEKEDEDQEDDSDPQKKYQQRRQRISQRVGGQNDGFVIVPPPPPQQQQSRQRRQHTRAFGGAPRNALMPPQAALLNRRNPNMSMFDGIGHSQVSVLSRSTPPNNNNERNVTRSLHHQDGGDGNGNGNGNQIPEAEGGSGKKGESGAWYDSWLFKPLLYFPFLDSTTSKKSSKKRRKKKKDSMDRAQTHHHHYKNRVGEMMVMTGKMARNQDPTQVSNNEDENDDDRLMTVAVDGVHSTTNGIDGNIAAVSSLVQAPVDYSIKASPLQQESSIRAHSQRPIGGTLPSNQQALLCHRHVPAHFFNVSNPDGGMGSDVPPQRGDCKSIFLPPPKKIRTHTMPLDDGGVGYQNGGAGQWDLYREEEARRVNYYKEMQGQQYGGGGAEEGFSILSSPDRRATMFINSPANYHQRKTTTVDYGYCSKDDVDGGSTVPPTGRGGGMSDLCSEFPPQSLEGRKEQQQRPDSSDDDDNNKNTEGMV